MIAKKNGNTSAITTKFVAEISGLSLPAASERLRKYKAGLLTYRQMLLPRGGVIKSKNKRKPLAKVSQVHFRGTDYKKTRHGFFYKSNGNEWIKANLNKSSLTELEAEFAKASARKSVFA